MFVTVPVITISSPPILLTPSSTDAIIVFVIAVKVSGIVENRPPVVS